MWAWDFFCVHTILFQTLYVFFVIRLAFPAGDNRPFLLQFRFFDHTGSSRNRTIPYAHRGEAPNESLAIGAIAITNDIARRLTPAAGLG
jgi:hypothetical protein